MIETTSTSNNVTGDKNFSSNTLIKSNIDKKIKKNIKSNPFEKYNGGTCKKI